jgi:hypothetical protein
LKPSAFHQIECSEEGADVYDTAVLTESFEMSPQFGQPCPAEQFRARSNVLNATELVLLPGMRIGKRLLLIFLLPAAHA